MVVLPDNIEFHRHMITNTQSFIQGHTQLFLIIHSCVTTGNNSINEIITIDKNTIIGASLTCIGFDFIVDDPSEINIIDGSKREDESKSRERETK